MTRRTLLAALAATGGAGGDAPAPVDDLTQIGTALRAAMPTSFAATFDVGPGRPHATIASAVTAARAEARRVNNSPYVGDEWTDPYRRVLIRVWPGEYHGPVTGLPIHTTILGMGANPQDVRIWDDVGDPGAGGHTGIGANVISTTGTSVHLRNVWLDHTNDDPEWHPIRDAGSSGTSGLRGVQSRTVILDEVDLTCAPTGMAGKSALDGTMDGTVILHRTRFLTPGQPQALNCGVNILSAAARIKTRVVFADCSITCAHGFVEDPTLPNNGRDLDGTPGDPAPIGLVDNSGASGDTSVWWVQGPRSTWDVGTETGQKIQGNIVVVTKGSPTKFHLDPAVPLPPTSGSPRVLVKDKPTATSTALPSGGSMTNAAGGVVDWDTSEALSVVQGIQQGASVDERAFYGPRPSASDPTRAATTITPTTVTLTAGRIYLVPVPLPATMLRVAKIGVDMTGSGSCAVGNAYPDPSTGAPSGSFISSGATTPRAGDIGLGARWFYPGHHVAWVAVAVTDSVSAKGATWQTSHPAVRVLDGYTGGLITSIAGSTPIPAGAAYPLPTIAA